MLRCATPAKFRTRMSVAFMTSVRWVLFFTVFATTHNQLNPVAVVSALIFFGLAVFVLIRFGLLALVANAAVYFILQNFPLTTQGAAWYSGISLAGILLIAAITLYGFYRSLVGRPVFGGAVLEE